MISNFINLGTLLLDVAKRLYPDNKSIGDAADTAGKIGHAYNVLSTNAMSHSANRTIIAPMVAVEESILHNEFMDDVMQIVMLRDITATLTHLALENAASMGVNITKLLGGINTGRGGMMALAGCEDFKDGPDTSNQKNRDKKQEQDKPGPRNSVVINGQSMPDLKEYAPLAIGRVVNATAYGENGAKIEFPLTFRQIPVPVSGTDLGLIFSAAKSTDGVMVRLLMAKSGEITWPELLTGKDLVKEEFRIRNEDMSGYYKEAMKRQSSAVTQAVRTGVVSMNSMANTFILSQDTANQLELQMGKRFANPRQRRDIYQAVKANTIVICNEDRGVFTFYTQGEDLPMPYTRKAISIKASKDNSSSSLSDLVKLLNGGM